MLGKVSKYLGFVLILVGIIWLRGPAVASEEYLYSLSFIAVGILVAVIGNLKHFKKNKDNNKNDQNT